MDALLQESANEVFAGSNGALYSPRVEESDTYNADVDDKQKHKKSTLEILQQSAQQIFKEDEIEFREVLATQAKHLASTVEAQREESEIQVFVKEVIKAEERESYDDDQYEIDEENNKDNIKDNVKYSNKQSDSEEDTEDNDEGGDRLNDPEERRKGFELLLACRKGDVRQAADLIKKGASLYYRDRHGWTIVHWAAAKGHAAILEDILSFCSRAKYLVNVTESITGWTALHLACIGGHVKAASILLKYGASKKKLSKLKERPLDCIISSDPNFVPMQKLFEK